MRKRAWAALAVRALLLIRCSVIPAKAGIHKLQRHMMEKQACVYILAKSKHAAFYIGVTSNLLGRLYQHREGLIKGHTSRYGIYHLVYFETFSDMASAIIREKQLKKWNRDWKINLIEGSNPEWVDLGIGFGFDPVRKK